MNNLMDLLRKTLFGILVVCVYFFLLGTSYDLLTKPNTLSNFLGFIGLTLLLALGMVFIYNAIKIMVEDNGIVDRSELVEAERKWKEKVETLEKKSNPKQFDGVESDKPFVKTRKKTNKTK